MGESKEDGEKEICQLDNAQDLEELYKRFNINETELMSSISLGFDMAVQSGPVCEEPMMGVCFIIKSLKYIDNSEVKEEKPKVEEKTE